MLEAAREAISFSEGRSREHLFDDRMLLHSLVRSIEIIGEAAVHVSADYKESASDIPWTELTGMRNRLIHAYFDIDPDIVWATTNRDLPPLIDVLERLLATDDGLDGSKA
jgi:uncharacterized protein with HEPN domain